MKDSIELSEKLVEEFKDTGRFFTNGPGPSALMWDSQDIRFDELEEKIAQAIHSTNTSLLGENKRFREALLAYRDAYDPPTGFSHDHFATGPLTGDPIQDYVTCPGCHAVKLCDQALSQQTEVDPWLPISEAPKDGTRILGYSQTSGKQFVTRWEERPMKGGHWTVYLDGEDGWVFHLGKNPQWLVVKPVTNWMPLPSPPKGGAK